MQSKRPSYAIVNAFRLKVILDDEPGELNKWLETMPENDLKEAILELIKMEKKEAIKEFKYNNKNRFLE